MSSHLISQILDEKVKNGSESYTFMERLLDISNENPKFTHADVIAETATILTGVRIIFHLNLLMNIYLQDFSAEKQQFISFKIYFQNFDLFH